MTRSNFPSELLAGIRASHEGAPSLDTVIGHSYGSTMVGAAAVSGHHLDADQVIAAGSPGMLADKAGDLNLNSGAHVYASQAQNDIIQFTKGTSLGPGPVDDATMPGSPLAMGSPSFGATEFDSDPGHALGPDWLQWAGIPSTEAHSSYFNQGSTGLLNMGQIIAGHEPTHHTK